MNELRKITVGIDPSKSVAIYKPALAGLLPGCDGEEARLRCGVLYLRDRAARARPIAATATAGVLLDAINDIAGHYALAPLPLEELDTLHRALVRVMLSAQALETRGPGRPIDAA